MGGLLLVEVGHWNKNDHNYSKEIQVPVSEIDIDNGRCFRHEHLRGCAIFLGANSPFVADA
jgi:hypothetical protein